MTDQSTNTKQDVARLIDRLMERALDANPELTIDQVAEDIRSFGLSDDGEKILSCLVADYKDMVGG